MHKNRRYTITIILAAIMLTSVTVSCGRSDNDRALDMLHRAQSATEAGQWQTAAATLDSIDSLYTAQADVRREAMRLMPTVREGLIQAELANIDSLQAVNRILIDSLQKHLERVDNIVEPYFVVKSIGRDAAGLNPRLMPDGTFYILSRQKVGHTRIEVAAADGSRATSSDVPIDGERNAMVSGYHTVHFVGAEIDTVGHFIARHHGEPLTIKIGVAAPVALPAQQAEAVATAWSFSDAMRQAQVLHLRRESAERRLDISRRQRAALTQE